MTRFSPTRVAPYRVTTERSRWIASTAVVSFAAISLALGVGLDEQSTSVVGVTTGVDPSTHLSTC